MSNVERSLAKSQEYLAAAQRYVPGCSQTFSKAPSQYVQGVSPAFIRRAQGCRVWDVDGNEYIDHVMSLDAIVIGYNDPDVVRAVRAQLEDGTIFSLPHPLEIEVARALTEVVPCAQMARFGKNGSDATSGAIRASRAITGREKVVCCGYHGWQDWYIGTTTRDRGVPRAVRDLTLTFPYNDAAALERLFEQNPGQIACVILEPIGVVEPVDNFLGRVREITRRHGALLVFDEMITGFRFAEGGAQEYFGVTPDFGCFGKAMANGYPVSAIVGPRDLMAIFDEVFFSFTFGGEALSLAAALATIQKIRREPVIDHVWRQGKTLQSEFNAMAQEFGLGSLVQCVGLPPRTVVTFKDASGADSLALRSLFQQEMVRRGMLFLVGFNPTFAHGDAEIDQTLGACRDVLREVKSAVESDSVTQRLGGQMVQAVFRRA
jgi:glutamate-1-semialdehyde aminotransferase